MTNSGSHANLAIAKKKKYITSYKRAPKFRMKNETLHSSKIMKICYKFHAVSGELIKHKLSCFTDFLLATQKPGMSSSRNRRTRTGLDYSSSTVPNIAYYTHRSLGLHLYFYNKQDDEQPNVSLSAVLKILLRTSTFMSSFLTAPVSYPPLLSH